MERETRCEVVMDATEQNTMKKRTTYMVEGRRFVVTPVFNEAGRDGLGNILMRLMQAEVVAGK